MLLKKQIYLLLAIILVFMSGIWIGRNFFNINKDENELVYANVNGTDIKALEVMPKIKNDLDQLENNKYDIKKRAVLEFISTKYNFEAVKKNEESEWKQNEISKEELHQFLSLRNMNEKKLSQLEMSNIINNMKFQKSVDAKKKKEAQNFDKLKIVWKIPLPPVRKIKVDNGNVDFWGAKTAPIEIVVVSNLHCPTCLMAEKKLTELKEVYKDQLKIFYRFTMQESPDSIVQLSAEAAMCAQAQNKFWNFHDLAIAQAPITSKKSLIMLGKSSGLDTEEFEKCIESRKNKSLIERDIEYAKKMEIAEAPMFVINGNVMSGLSSMDHLSRLIESLR